MSLELHPKNGTDC